MKQILETGAIKFIYIYKYKKTESNISHKIYTYMEIDIYCCIKSNMSQFSKTRK